MASGERFQAIEVGWGVDVQITPGQGDGIDRFGVAGEQWSGAVVATELAQLREVGGGEEGRDAHRAGIAGGDDAAAGLAPCADQHAKVPGGDGGLVADCDADGVVVAGCIEGGQQGAGHAGLRGRVLHDTHWQTMQQRSMLGGARAEDDDGHDEAGIEQHAGRPGE